MISITESSCRIGLIFVLTLLIHFNVIPAKTMANDSLLPKSPTPAHAKPELEELIINSSPPHGPNDPGSIVQQNVPDGTQAITIISDVPAFTWSFGSAPTSAAMIAGYYDRNGLPDMYTGPANGGIMPLDNDAYWTTWIDGSGAELNRCPLSATQMGLDGRATTGHVDDYWISENSTANDPFITNGWTQHTAGDCLGDFMGSNQSSYPMGNADGTTHFFFGKYGDPITADDIFASGPFFYGKSGMYGIKEFYESRGYVVNEAYNQYIMGYNGNTKGFTYNQYKTQIDTGHPVLIHLSGHTVVGTGYDDSSDLVYIHDTWDHLQHTMTWGDAYNSMAHVGVSVVIPEIAPPPPPPPTGQFVLPPIFLVLDLLEPG
ncbi:MAG: hypothetical protein D3926_14435 [Desulfobacteraceae bacterium]|nr:MAG: hypothetical protein D3926_14435 [Desulfobacteraceae bacterium]